MKLKENNTKLTDGINEKELALLESALYVAGRPLSLQKLSSIIGTRSKDKVLKLAQTLVKIYKSKNSAIELLKFKDKRFVMQLNAGYAHRVKRLSQRPILTSGPLKTLSYVAYHQPVLQTKVAEARSSNAYSHLKKLEKLKLITRERAGRTKVIRTTQTFSDLYGLSSDIRIMKRQLKRLFKQLKT